MKKNNDKSTKKYFRFKRKTEQNFHFLVSRKEKKMEELATLYDREKFVQRKSLQIFCFFFFFAFERRIETLNEQIEKMESNKFSSFKCFIFLSFSRTICGIRMFISKEFNWIDLIKRTWSWTKQRKSSEKKISILFQTSKNCVFEMIQLKLQFAEKSVEQEKKCTNEAKINLQQLNVKNEFLNRKFNLNKNDFWFF